MTASADEPDPLLVALRQTASTAIAELQARLEREEEAVRQDADRILEALPAIAHAAAEGGRFEVSLMEVAYDGRPHWVHGHGFVVYPAQLAGASRLVYEDVARRGFRPELRCFWQRVRRRVSRIVCQLVVHW